MNLIKFYVCSESHWKYTENTFEALKPKLSKLGFNAMEQQHVEDLLRFIEARKLGVPVTDLLVFTFLKNKKLVN